MHVHTGDILSGGPGVVFIVTMVPPLQSSAVKYPPSTACRDEMRLEPVSAADQLYYVHETCHAKPLAYIQQTTGYQTPAAASKRQTTELGSIHASCCFCLPLQRMQLPQHRSCRLLLHSSLTSAASAPLCLPPRCHRHLPAKPRGRCHFSSECTTDLTFSRFRSTYVCPTPQNMMGAPDVYTIDSAAPTCAD